MRDEREFFFFFKMKRRRRQQGKGDTFAHRLNNKATAATTSTSVAVDVNRLKTWSTSCPPFRSTFPSVF
jgi:hypothetical protein